MAELIGAALARALDAGRARYNALYAQAKHTTPALDAGAFGEFLLRRVGPVAEAVDRVQPDAGGAVTDVLYEIALELVRKDLPGRSPALGETWSRVLAGLAGPLAAAPRVLAGSITNALYNLARVPGARPGEWADELLRAAPLCPDVPALLAVGQVCAWRAGLAHFREGALEACAKLPAAAARAALGLPAGGKGSVKEVIAALREDPWLAPGADPAAARPLRVAAVVGGFRGFGGPFLRPPRVVWADGRFHVGDGERCWVLTADRFGATLHAGEAALPRDQSAGSWQVDKKGQVSDGSERAGFEDLREVTGKASSPTTLAVTVALSHRLYLIARSQP